ncbi:hypothetical protein BZA77DRAFT_325359 [Pyronema omphalodes]|nr:hypothetical protein BZA77DRAFT_325359 [Pyronema omphalodes]
MLRNAMFPKACYACTMYTSCTAGSFQGRFYVCMYIDWVSGLLGFWVSGFLGFWVSGLLGFWVSVFLSF